MNSPVYSTAALRLGDFEIDRASRMLRKHGQPVPLGARALDLLWALVAARGELLTKDELLRLAWPGLVVEEANVQVQVSALRKVLGSDAIATVPSLGYRLALPVTEAEVRPSRHNLATERTPFIGRAAALEDAQSRLARGVLLTLIGIGGTGKTRLARRLAELELDRFEDGVWWVDLAPLDRSEQLVPAVAQAVDCPPSGAAAPIEALARALQPKHILLVLDNCEHLVDAVCAMLETLLSAAPGLRVLATSREALCMPGELLLPVKPLDTPPRDATPEQVWACDAAQLFLQAAEYACPSLTFEDEAAPQVAEMCRRLDGIPLALELAATQLRVIGLQQLEQTLQQHFHLALGAPRSLPRQLTLQAVIRWSVDRVGVPERRVLSALAVCAGGCDLDAVHAILDSKEPREALIPGLAHLCECSLIVVRHADGIGRYQLLETVRQYVLEALAGEFDAAALRSRHSSHFRLVAQALVRELAGSGRSSALARLDLERENLFRAADWALSMRQWTQGASLVGALMPYWTARSLLMQGLDLAQAVLDIATPDEDRPLAAALCLDAASLAGRMGRLGQARALATRALDLATQAGKLDDEIQAQMLCAYCDVADGRGAAAVSSLEWILARSRRAGLKVQECDALSALGQARLQAGDFDAAYVETEQAARLYAELGNATGAAIETLRLAELAVRQGDAAKARRLMREVAQRRPRIEHHAVACHALFVSASLAALEEQWSRCLQAHLAALRHMAIGDLGDDPVRALIREGELGRARRALDAATREAVESAAGSSLATDLAWAFEGITQD